MNRPEITTAYTEKQYDEGYPLGIENHWWNASRCWYIARQLRALNLDKANILEIGCGRGAVIKGLDELGIRVHGVELADVPPLAEVSDRIQFAQDATELPKNERDSVDAILLLDVIEHIENDTAFMRNIIAHFPNANTVLICVPARQELWSNFDSYYGHFRRYNLASLATLASSTGQEPLYIKYFFHLPYLPARLLSALNISRELNIRPPLGFFPKLIHRLVAAAMQLDHLFIPGDVPGSSAIMALRLNHNKAI